MTGRDLLSATERDRILRAMADCCAEHGFRETSIEAVIERADVRRDDFNAHFVDLEDCALGALNKAISEAWTALSTVGSGRANPERLQAQVLSIVHLITSEPAFARLACIESRQLGTSRMRDAYKSATHVLALMLERVEPGSGQRPPASCARASLGGAEALVRRDLSQGNIGRVGCHLTDFAYAILVPFVGQAEALRQSRVVADSATEEG